MQCLALRNYTILYKKGFYFVKGFLLMDLCKQLLTKWVVTEAASSRFSLLHLIRPEGRIFVFIRTRQVVF
jgi:hypothetical protein